MPIRRLPPETVARIAAGEVVERPASVAKELIENALDAGASRIDVEVQGGGIALLRVVDDGAGIPAGEAELAFERHATSKLEAPGDLERVTTLGFRGEALASIASVADVSLLTRTADAPGGTWVRVVNGEVVERSPRGAPPGTSVTVRHLFRDVPARLKFLKSNAAEASRITTVVSHYALACPRVRFSLTVDGRRVFSSQGSGGVRQAVAGLYGLETAEAMLEVDHREAIGGVETAVAGLVSPPALTRASRGYVTIFVNRRLVQSRSLAFAVLGAYEGLLTSGRYPIAVLDLAIDPSETDVNVHPAKAEVRFRDEGIAFSAVHRAVRQRLLTEGVARPLKAVPAAAGPGVETPPARGAPFASPLLSSPPGAPGTVAPAPVAGPAGSVHPPPGVVAPAAAPVQGGLGLPILRVLGQLKSTFIVAEGPDGMYLIDQHAAHERVLFDRMRRAKGAGRVDVQGLLEPVTVTLTPAQERTLVDQLGRLAAYGFQAEPFGERTALVRAAPAAMRRTPPGRALVDVLDYMLSDDLKGYDWEDRVLASIACHSAVRAGQELSAAEMEEMVRLLESADTPHACPHGRPVMVHMSNAQLEREFSRR
jgi:DNA mismatch repair protein MutL